MRILPDFVKRVELGLSNPARFESSFPMTTKHSALTVADGLSKAIFEQRLLPGAKLNEDEVAEIFGVSRTIVRAALQKLVHDRLAVFARNRGTHVAHPTPKEAREVFEARSLVEPRTSRSAAERITEGKLARLQHRIDQEHEALAQGNPGLALHASGLFHIEIAHIADQATIAEFIEGLVARSSLIIALYWRRQSALCESHAHHALMEAFAKGDAKFAEELMQSHIVDLASSLDLSGQAFGTNSLKEALAVS